MIARNLPRNGLRSASRIVLAAFCMVATAIADGGGGGAMRAGPAFANEVEGSLVRAIVGLREAGLKTAMGEIDKALDRNPNYRLAHMVKGDMLMARAGKPVAFASLAADHASVAPLQDEARVRLQRYLDAPRVDYLPAPVVQLAESQSHVLLVDTSRSRLFVYANDLGRPRYVTDFYISLGKNGVEKSREGDQKTPIGVYRITSARERLPDFYGPGAYPIDYPNDWDRMNGRKGHGIWLHGTPSATYARPPWATDGCIVLTNDDLAKLTKYVDVSRTPVVIGHAVEWQDMRRWEADREAFLAAFTQWRKDWESRDLERYFTHYSGGFRTESRDLASWKVSKRRSNSGKAWIKVGVNDLSLFAYPGAKDLMMVTFEQDYRSNNLSNRTVKRQYWVREPAGWRIVHEAVVS
ncbi:MAG TPA: L,D-transpeptidase family protein [Usitatibacter sp.]|nr:L,D-transpeptidase family protein [Usitatibacter sp.]